MPFVLALLGCGNWASSSKDGTEDADCAASTCALQHGTLPTGYPIIAMYGAQAPCDTSPVSEQFIVLDYTFAAQGGTYHCGDEYEEASERAADVFRAVQAGAALWYPVTGGPALSRLSLASGPMSFGVRAGDGVQNVYLHSGYNSKLPDAIAVTICNQPVDGLDCYHTECDIVFYALSTSHGSHIYDTCEVASSGAGNVSLQTVFAHELGHALGLGDVTSTYTDSLMWETISEREWEAPTAEDLAAAAYIYGAR